MKEHEMFLRTAPQQNFYTLKKIIKK